MLSHALLEADADPCSGGGSGFELFGLVEVFGAAAAAASAVLPAFASRSSNAVGGRAGLMVARVDLRPCVHHLAFATTHDAAADPDPCGAAALDGSALELEAGLVGAVTSALS